VYIVDLYRRGRRAHFVEGMSIREAARMFNLHRSTVNKMLEYSVPPGYRREQPPTPWSLRRYWREPYGVCGSPMLLGESPL
jgi:transposase